MMILGQIVAWSCRLIKDHNSVSYTNTDRVNSDRVNSDRVEWLNWV